MASALAATLAAVLFACAPSPAVPLGASSGAPLIDVAPTPRALPPDVDAARRGGTVIVRFLDVGQGDAAIVTTDDKHAMLIDAGPPEAHARVTQALRALGDASLDVMVLSHAHVDHMGQLNDVFAKFAFKRWLRPNLAPPGRGVFISTQRAATDANITQEHAQRGQRFELGPHVGVEVLAPGEPLLRHTRSDMNANSVVLRIDHHAKAGDVRILFTGDAEEPTEKRLLEEPSKLRADVLKVAHHGSQHASTEALLAAVSPRLAVISCGRGNDYGHPHARTLDRLARQHVAVARTDSNGDVTVTSDAHGLAWTSDRAIGAAELRTPGVGGLRIEP